MVFSFRGQKKTFSEGMKYAGISLKARGQEQKWKIFLSGKHVIKLSNNDSLQVITGHMHNFEKNLIRCCWSPGGDMVAAGSADRCYYKSLMAYLMTPNLDSFTFGTPRRGAFCTNCRDIWDQSTTWTSTKLSQFVSSSINYLIR